MSTASHKQSSLLSPCEWIELVSGICLLGALMWILWWNGFGPIPEEQVSVVLARETILVLLMFQLYGVTGILKSPQIPKNQKKLRWLQLALILLAILSMVGQWIDWQLFHRIEAQNIRRAMYLVIGVAPLLQLKTYFFRVARVKPSLQRRPKIPPALLFLLSLLIFISIGGVLLQSPGATRSGMEISMVDAFFLSTSAVCVTGLVPLNVHDHLTNYGQTILLLLFQIGAFGVMTFTYFVSIMVGHGLSLRSKVVISNLLDEEGIAKMDTFIKNIIAVTFGVEALGALFLYFSWCHIPGLSGDTLWWFAIFHAVSGFCNAGFSLFADNLATPVISHNFMGQAVIAMLVLCGSLGFAVYLEMVRKGRMYLKIDPPTPTLRHWSTHTWLVARMTLIMVLGGAVLLFICKTISGITFHIDEPWYWSLWESTFNSIARTAGFNVSDITVCGVPYALVLCGLMFIGGNPGSTTGGVHTTAFAVSCMEGSRILQGKQDVVIHRRRIARSVVERAMLTIVLGGFWVGLMTIIMCFAEPNIDLERLVFEVISSFATVGFSLNVTPELSSLGKSIIIFNMIVGRVGMISFLLAFMKPPSKSPLRYPETRIPLS